MGTASVSSLAAAAPPPAATRFAPVGWSWNPLVWLGALIYRLAVGGDAPMKIIFARSPRLIPAHLLLVGTCESLTLEKRLRAMARVLGSRINNCLFCDDLETRLAIRHRAITQEDADALPMYATSDRFSEREKAALRYVEELNTTKRATDETFDALRRHLSEREIVELTFLNAVGNYLNLQAKPFGLQPEGACEIPRRSTAAKA